MQIPLIGASYEARSVIASAQRCINLYPEINPESAQATFPVTHYETPGLYLLKNIAEADTVRCTYRTSNGYLYVVVGHTIYYINSAWGVTHIGTIASSTTPVYMQDNGLAILVIDGTPDGYAIDMESQRFSRVSSTNFYGGDRVDYLDTFFLLNRPGTNQFYVSLALVTFDMLVAGTAFDSLDIAAKSGYPDPLSGLIVMHREIWLIGQLTTEIWYNTGASDFVFQSLPGAFIEHGCVAKNSIATQDLSVYWLSQDEQGQAIVMRGASYQALRISTHAIENEFQKYAVISDAIGFTYQQDGHTFYVLTFPSANKTWVYDQATELWHERTWTDSNGNLNRHRMNCMCNVYGKNVAGDWQNGNLYDLNLGATTDNGQPISRIRAFPLFNNGAKRVSYGQFIADMEVGNDDGAIDGSDAINPPVVSLRWSNNRGKTWGNRLQQSLGAAGEYDTCLQWQRTGMARYRVFELSWSAPVKTSLNGAFVSGETSIS